MFYIAQYPVRWTTQSALHFLPPLADLHSDTNSASPGSILAKQHLLATTKSLTFPPLPIARYSASVERTSCFTQAYDHIFHVRPTSLVADIRVKTGQTN